MRSDNGSEFTAKRIRKRLREAGSITASIEPGSSWENGNIESFHAHMQAEFASGELFDAMYEACALPTPCQEFFQLFELICRIDLIHPRFFSLASHDRIVRFG